MSSNIEKCYQCGQCTSVCPMGEHEQAYKIRRFLQLEKINEKSEGILSLPAIFYCTTCYKCQDNCPQGVKIVDAVLEIREYAVHNGNILPPHRKVANMLLKTGQTVPPNEDGKKKRIQLGLNELSSNVASYPNHLIETQKLLNLCNFENLINDNKSTELLKSPHLSTSMQIIEGHA